MRLLKLLLVFGLVLAGGVLMAPHIPSVEGKIVRHLEQEALHMQTQTVNARIPMETNPIVDTPNMLRKMVAEARTQYRIILIAVLLIGSGICSGLAIYILYHTLSYMWRYYRSTDKAVRTKEASLKELKQHRTEIIKRSRFRRAS